MRERLAAVDGLRGLAILMVTAFHLWRMVGRPLVQPLGIDITPLLPAGADGFFLFLTLSGFCLYLPHALGRPAPAAWGFYRRRLWRIVPPYYLTLAVWLPLWATAPDNPGRWAGWWWHLLTHATFTHTLTAGTFGSVCGILWFVGPLVHLYLTFPLLARAMRRPVLVGAGTAAWLVALALMVPHLGDSPVAWRNLLTLGPYFLLGILAAHLYSRHAARLRPLAGMLTVYGLAQVLVVPLLAEAYLWTPALVLSRALGWAALTLGLALESQLARVLVPPPLPWLGPIAYSLYLANYLPLRVPAWFGALAGSPAWWALAVGSLVAGSLATYYLAERPSRRPLKQRGRDLEEIHRRPTPALTRPQAAVDAGGSASLNHHH